MDSEGLHDAEADIEREGGLGILVLLEVVPLEGETATEGEVEFDGIGRYERNDCDAEEEPEAEGDVPPLEREGDREYDALDECGTDPEGDVEEEPEVEEEAPAPEEVTEEVADREYDEDRDGEGETERVGICAFAFV